MKETYRECAFTAESLARIAIADKILATYAAEGLRLTLRQLYYQFVAHHALPNTERSYKNLGELVSKARLAGKLDWEAIEDRVRQPQEARDWSSPSVFADAAVGAYRLPRQLSFGPRRVEIQLPEEPPRDVGAAEPVKKI